MSAEASPRLILLAHAPLAVASSGERWVARAMAVVAAVAEAPETGARMDP